VFHSGGDVIKMGLVASLNRPSGNATGCECILCKLLSREVILLPFYARGLRGLRQHHKQPIAIYSFRKFSK
jgi:hypothetical protein